MEKDELLRRFPLLAVQLARITDREPPDMQDEAFLAKYEALSEPNKKAFWLGIIMGGGASTFIFEGMCPTEDMELDGDMDPVLAQCIGKFADNMEAMEGVTAATPNSETNDSKTGERRETHQPKSVNDFSATQRRSCDSSFGAGLEQGESKHGGREP